MQLDRLLLSVPYVFLFNYADPVSKFLGSFCLIPTGCNPNACLQMWPSVGDHSMPRFIIFRRLPSKKSD